MGVKTGAVCILTALSMYAAEPDQAALLARDHVAAGQKLFAAACSGCHGKTGEGGRGPNLADGVLVRRSSNERLFQSIHKGVPGSDMPGFPLAEPKIWQIVGYLRSLSAPAGDADLPGSVEQGRAIFLGKGQCSGCHAIRGEGGELGPDLTNIGVTRTVKQLRESLLDPSARIAEGYEAVRVTLDDGTTIEGVARNRNNFSMQVLDRKGNVHLLDNRKVVKAEFSEKSLMPQNAASKLTPDELRDLMAFLGRQSVRQGASD